MEFTHPARILALANADEVDNLPSEAFYGASTNRVVHIRTTMAETTRDAAAELAASPRQAVEDHFAPGQTIAAVGDSLTDDVRFWAYILAELLAVVFPDEPAVVLSFGKSGDDTVHIIEKNEQPTCSRSRSNYLSAFQLSPRTETLLADGLYPNPIDQKLIAAELLANL